MNLFKRDYNKPGPGVPKRAPRKKGIARFFEVLARDAGNLLKLNIIYQIIVLPAQAMLALALWCFLAGDGLWMAVFAGIGLLCGAAVGPANTAMSYLLTKMLRDDPGFVWHDFKAKFKECFKSTAPAGVVYSLVLGGQIFGFIYYTQILTSSAFNLFVTALYLLSVLLFWMASPFFFLQSAYLAMKPGGIVKNSLLLALGYAPRSFAGAVLSVGLSAAQVLLLPFSAVFTLAAGYTLPTLLCAMWIWPVADRTFGIERTLRSRAGLDPLPGDEPAADEPPPA